jgi:hypothetical protein
MDVYFDCFVFLRWVQLFFLIRKVTISRFYMTGSVGNLSNQNQKGVNVWHWEGMSDDEDDMWADSDTDNEDEETQQGR